MKQQDRKSSRYSLVVTAFLQLALLAVFYFITAWQAPDPPLPVYGIELALVMSSDVPTSSSEPSVEPEREITPEQTAETEVTTNDTNENPESTSEEVTADTQKGEASTEALVENKQELTEVSPSESSTEVSTNDEYSELQGEKNDSTVPVQNNEPETDAQATPSEATNPEQKLVSDSVEVDKTSEIQTDSDEVTEAALIDERALFPSSGTTDKAPESNVVLNISGYQLSEPPKINDTSNESGSITFKIIVADDGYAIPVQTVQSTLSPSVTALYRDAINQLYFEKTSSQVPPETTGTITFIIKAN